MKDSKMPKIETWKCDHCNEEYKEQGNMQYVHILTTTEEIPINIYNLRDKVLYTMLWCHACICDTNMGVRHNQKIKSAKEKEEAIEEAKTSFEARLKELLADIISDEVTEQLSDQ